MNPSTVTNASANPSQAPVRSTLELAAACDVIQTCRYENTVVIVDEADISAGTKLDNNIIVTQREITNS